jgi:hypothetical protein
MSDDNKNYRISGFLIDGKSHQGIESLRIEAWDKDLIFDDLVGTAISNEQGAFQIEFGASHYQGLFLESRPDLYFKVFHYNNLLKSTEDSVLWNIESALTEITIEVEYERAPQR